MFVLLARFAHDDVVLGGWPTEGQAVTAANGLDRHGLEVRLEAADGMVDGDDLAHLCVLEVGPAGVVRGDVWAADGDEWLADFWDED